MRVKIVIRRKSRSLCIYPELHRTLGSFVHSGPFIEIFQMQRSFEPHVIFCLEMLRILLITFFGPGIDKFQNGEDETSLPLLVKELFNHVYELKFS